MKKQNAFTLAEVLITLTIVGVIAAITIPNLIQGYKKHQVEVGVKEAYSILSNIIKMSEAEHGSATEWNYGLDIANFTSTYIYPYLQIAKKCSPLSSCYNSGDDRYFYKNLNNTYPDNKAYNYPAIGSVVVLKNGMTLGVGVLENVSNSYCHNGGIVFYVDIDGKRGDSVLGKDIFAFSMLPQLSEKCSSIPRGKVNSLVPGIYGSCHCYGLIFDSQPTNTFLSTRSGGCNISADRGTGVPQGALCSSAIAKNGWKIPDDYPVKKF